MTDSVSQLWPDATLNEWRPAPRQGLRAEPKRFQARWSAAALVAPAAAAVFTGVTTWTMHHRPAGTNASVSATSTAKTPVKPRPVATTADPQLSALRNSIARDRAKVATLKKALAVLRSPARAGRTAPAAGSPGQVGGSSGVPGTGTGATYAGGSAGTGPASAAAGTSSYAAAPAAPAYNPPPAYNPAPAAAPAPAPAPVVQPAPAPAPAAPPTNTRTGASGAPK